jgi:transposase
MTTMEQSNDAREDSGRFVGNLSRRTRSGSRVWSNAEKGRAVFESMKPGTRVCDVAKRYGIHAQQLTAWRGQARKGQIALVSDETSDFVTIEVSDPAIGRRDMAPVDIFIGKVTVRLDADASSTRIAEIATALERCA